MKLKEFVDEIAAASAAHKEFLVGRGTQADARTATTRETPGLHCQLCLDADGNVSAQATEVRIAFSLWL